MTEQHDYLTLGPLDPALGPALQGLGSALADAARGGSPVVLLLGGEVEERRAAVDLLESLARGTGAAFCQGAYDHGARCGPHSGLFAALRDRLAQVERLPNEERQLWIERILRGLGDRESQVDVELPELRRLLAGRRTPPIHTFWFEVGLADDRARFQHACARLVRVFAGSRRPLAVVLTALQHADADERALLRHLADDPRCPGRLLVLSGQSAVGGELRVIRTDRVEAGFAEVERETEADLAPGGADGVSADRQLEQIQAAADRMLAAAAYRRAARVLGAGLDLVGQVGAPRQVQLRLLSSAARAAQGQGDEEARIRWSERAMALADGLEDELSVRLTELAAAFERGSDDDVLASYRGLMVRAGLQGPRSGGKLRAAWSGLTLLWQGARLSPRDIHRIPLTSSPLVTALQRVQMMAVATEALSDPEAAPRAVLRDVRALRRFGASRAGAFLLLGYAGVSHAVFGRPRRSMQLLRMVLTLQERIDDPRFRSRTRLMALLFLGQYEANEEQFTRSLRETAEESVQMGDWEAEGVARVAAALTDLVAGTQRPSSESFEQTRRQLEHLGDSRWIGLQESLCAALGELAGQDPSWGEATPPGPAGPLVAGLRVFVGLCASDLDLVQEHLDGALPLMRPRIWLGVHILAVPYLAAAALWAVEEGDRPWSRVRPIIRRARRFLRRMVPLRTDINWALSWLRGAELAARGRDRKARAHLDLAVLQAMSSSRPLPAALAGDCLARVCQRLGLADAALEATRRSERLRRRWQSDEVGTVPRSLPAPGGSGPGADIREILRASQALSEVTDSSRLPIRTLELLASLTGAESGLVVLAEPTDLRLVARVMPGSGLVTKPGGAAMRLNLDLVRDALKQARLLLHNRADRSILASPLVWGGDVRGAVQLVSRAGEVFSASHLETVRLLSAQAAISLENAALVDDLEHEVHKRTEALDRARDRAEVANRAKGDFLANMSHELRTPLNAILGYSQILIRRPDLDEAARDAVQTVQDSGRHLLGLIDDVLDMAKVESGHLELVPEETDLPALAQGVVDLLEVRARRKGLDLRLALAPGLPEVVLTDPRRLRQVLLNLLGNAVKFTTKGSVELRVAPEGGTGLHFAVRDTGPGIAAAELERIFRPFEQAGRAEARAAGTGLGLAISRRLVELMGGELEVESEPGRGSVFRFAVSITRVSNPSRALASLRRVVTGYHGPPRSLLVVDDRRVNRMVLLHMLEPLGFDVRVAEDGAQGLEQAARSLPDLVLMDLVMPEMDGFAAAAQLRGDPSTAGIPLVAVSSQAIVQGRQADADSLFDGVLSKPVDVELLLDQLAELLDLEWIVQGGGVEPVEPEGDLGPQVAPPPAALAALRRLAELGNMTELAEAAGRLAKEEPALAPLAAALRGYAREFDDAAAVALLQGLASPAE